MKPENRRNSKINVNTLVTAKPKKHKPHKPKRGRVNRSSLPKPVLNFFFFVLWIVDRVVSDGRVKGWSLRGENDKAMKELWSSESNGEVEVLPWRKNRRSSSSWWCVDVIEWQRDGEMVWLGEAEWLWKAGEVRSSEVELAEEKKTAVLLSDGWTWEKRWGLDGEVEWMYWRARVVCIG